MKLRRCKNCKERFQPLQPLQYVCGYKCANEYQKLLKANKEAKEWKVKKAQMKITTHAKEYKKSLQDSVNKLSRMIDARFNYITCIDCNKNFGKQIDAAHYHSRGANSSLKYNLDNLHSAKSDCNQFSDNHKLGYKIGLIDRYGDQYTQYVIEDMPLKYSYVKLTPDDVVEKLAITRKLVRDFDTFKFTDSLNARKILNEIIGIYK